MNETFLLNIVTYLNFSFHPKRADLAVSSLTVTEARENVVDFTVAFMFYTDEILLKKTYSKEKSDLLQFMSPFHDHVWFCTLATLILISVAVFVINYLSPYGHKNANGKGTSEEFSFFNSMWFALACMLQQGGDNTPRNLSGQYNTSRIIVTFKDQLSFDNMKNYADLGRFCPP